LFFEDESFSFEASAAWALASPASTWTAWENMAQDDPGMALLRSSGWEPTRSIPAATCQTCRAGRTFDLQAAVGSAAADMVDRQLSSEFEAQLL
jgi:hypothetical protein